MSFISKFLGKKIATIKPGHNFANTSAVCEAAREGNVLEVMNLMNKGIDINATGGGTLDFSPLMWAAEEGNIEMIKLLLDNGANPNLMNRRGMGALLLASKNGHMDAVKALLEKGAEVEYETQGVTPLYAAAAYGHFDIVRVLLEHGAKDNKGLALEAASQLKNEEIMNLLSHFS